MEGNGRAIYEKGKEIGETDTILRIVKKLLVENYNFNQISALLGLSKKDQDKYLALLNQE